MLIIFIKVIKLKFNDFKDLLNNLITIIAFRFSNLKQHLLLKILLNYQNDFLDVAFIF